MIGYRSIVKVGLAIVALTFTSVLSIPAGAATPSPAWKATISEVSTTRAGGLDSMSCPTASSCHAIGYYTTGKGTSQEQHSLIMSYNGASWTSTLLVDKTNPLVPEELWAVSCPRAGWCAAVGGAGGGWGGPHPVVDSLAATLSNGTWREVTVPAPVGPNFTSLTSVSCWSKGACLAIGYANTTGTVGFGTTAVMYSVLAGGTWTSEAIPSSSGYQLSDVVCLSATSCIAVGRTYGATPLDAVVGRFDGHSWTFTTLVNTSGSTNEQLTGLTCSSPSWCMAVGGTSAFPFVDSGSVGPLAVQISPSSTTASLVPIPAGGNGSALLDNVSCVSMSHCVAVGSQNGGIKVVKTSAPQAFVSTLSKGKWTSQGLPKTGLTTTSSFDVSCSSASRCLSVGQSMAVNQLFEPWTALFS